MNADLLPYESSVLDAYHTEKADFCLACTQTQIKIANKEPLYTFGVIQTKQDWLNRAADYESQRKHHRERARFFKKFVLDN